MVYHHIYHQPAAHSFTLRAGSFSAFLHYARRGALQFNHPEIGSQLLPEDHFQMYFVTTPAQEFRWNGGRICSLLSFEARLACLDPIADYSPVIHRFMNRARTATASSLFPVPQQATPENKWLLEDLFRCPWNERHVEHMLRVLLLPALRSFNRSSLTLPRSDSGDPIYAVAEWILLHLDEPISIGRLSQQFLLNEFKLKADFRNIFGVPVISFQRKARVEKAKQLLSEPGTSIAVVARKVGFGHTAYFSDFFRRETGLSPSAFRKKNPPETAVSADPALRHNYYERP